jgi:ATP-dependent Clp protease ATP-binding subunit ClpA
MRLLQHNRRPRAKTIRPAEPYLLAGAEQARRLRHNYIGTEHILSILIRNPDSAATHLLAQLGTTAEDVQAALACWLEDATPAGKIDPDALAALGIDFETVRDRLEQTFGPGALERCPSSCLGICPRLKMALACALDYAGEQRLDDEHVLLGMLSVPDSVAARVLCGLGVTLEAAETKVAPGTPKRAS